MSTTPEEEPITKDKFKLDMSIPGVDPRNLPTDNFLLFTVVFVAIYFMAVVYKIVPEIKKTFTNYNRLQKAEAELKRYQQRQERVTSILHNPYYSPEMTHTINDILYDTNPYVEVLLTINELADQYHLKISGLEYSPGIVATPSAELAATIEENYPINFNLSGTFGDIATFLAELEMHAPFNSVSASKITNDTIKGTASAQVEILAQYHLPEIYLEQTSINADTNLPEIGVNEQQTLATLQKMTRKTYDLSRTTIGDATPKINLFALDDLGVTLASDSQEQTQYFYDPNTGEMYTYTENGVPVIVAPESIAPASEEYPESDEHLEPDQNEPVIIDTDPSNL